jgi:GNAT superfamily N-acetyltransferase
MIGQPAPNSDLRLLVRYVEAIFRADAHGRLVGDAPQFYVLRTPDGCIWRCHADLADEVATGFEKLCRQKRGRPSRWAQEYGDYLTLLAPAAPITAIRAGPLYCAPDQLTTDGAGIAVDERNAHLLCDGLDEWLPDVRGGLPMMAVVADGRAVAICASVCASATVHCAGVETLPAYRRKGFGARAVAGWAGAVQAKGATPFYGTTFDNIESQRVARRLGLNLVGTEFSIECGPISGRLRGPPRPS